jgi:hypothetical protein
MSWLRANRWWLPLVPLGLVAMLAGSGYRVQTFWWESGLHRESASAPAGQYAQASQDFEDALGPTRRTFAVRVANVTEVDRIPGGAGEDERAVPKGVTAYQVNLGFRAEPDQDLNGCQVTLLDERGHRYGGDTTDPLGQVYRCVPEDTPGAASPLLKGDRRGVVDPDAVRPEEWVTHTVVLVPDDVTPTKVWISFAPPDYVSLPLPR